MKQHLYSFLFGVALLAFGFFGTAAETSAAIRVVVWDERQELQKTAYGDYLGNTLAAHLAKMPGLDR